VVVDLTSAEQRFKLAGAEHALAPNAWRIDAA
jgi:hypothetical protein